MVDPSGAGIPNADVSCQDRQTALTYHVATDSTGLFRFPDLPIGTYDVTASSKGFSSAVNQDVKLATGHSVDLLLQLQIGSTLQTTTVSGAVQVIQPTSSELQTSVENKNMTDLPLNGRNPLQLVTLTPGAVNTGSGNSFQAANGQFAVNGNRGTDNGYTLDGVSYSDPHFGTAPVLPSPDALEEFTVKSSNFAASESGAGANIQFSTRSGTNQFHGTAFEYLRNDVLDSRNFFASTSTPFKRNQFGGTVGGPIWKDKTFFFLSYQATRVVGGASPSIATPPNVAYRSGNFAGGRIIIDPTTHLPFANNAIPASRIDPLSARVLSLIPLPNQPNGTFTAKPRTDQDDDQLSARIDHNFTPKDRLTLRYFYDDFRFQEATSPFPDIYGSDAFHNQNGLVSETHIFNPNLILVGTFGYTRVPRSRSANLPATMLGLGANVPLATPNAPSELNVGINGYANLVSGTPIQIRPETYEYRAHFSWTKGKHLLQFGIDVFRNHEFALDQSRSSGTWTFDGSRTASTAISNSGDAFADFLLGAPQVFAQHGASPQDLYETKIQPWIQDDWKIRPNFTLNLGLRWEPWLPATDEAAPQVGFVPGVQSSIAPLAPLGLLFSGDRGLSSSIFPRDWNNLAPRVGFAWDLNGRGTTVIRGAYGIFYRPSPLNLQRFSGNTAAFRGLTTNISNPASFANPYLGIAGGDPFPWTAPTVSDLATYPFTRPVVTSALDPATRTSYVQQWNFTVERQVQKDMGISLSYIGNRMVKGLSSSEGNPGIYMPGATAQNVNSRRPYAGIGSLQYVFPFQNSNYNAMQVALKKQSSSGLTLIANYTWSKCLDNNSQTIGSVSVTHKLDPNLDYGPCDFDITQRGNLSLVYDIPRITALHGIVSQVVNDWSLTSIVTLQTGLPISVYSGRDNAFSGPTTNSGNNDFADLVLANTNRPNGANSLVQWFNTSAFRVNAVGTYGNIGRNLLTGPSLFDWDLGVLKRFPIHENMDLQYRAEAFNATNHTNFSNPVATVSNLNFGKILSAASPRVIQMSLRFSF